jgi:cell division protein FtsI/penicillin-binding protein 2
MSVVGLDDGYDLALMAGRHLTSLVAVAVATVAGLTLMSNAAATRPAVAVPPFAGARSGTAVVLDPATGAVLGIGASHLRPARGGTVVVLDPATGAVLRIGASHLRPARGGTVVVLDPATGAVLRIR